MVPTAFVMLTYLPLNANGKLDRKALAALDADMPMLQEYVAPEGEIEAMVASIWQDLLNVEPVGRQDSFFALGGHSLLVVQLVSRMRQELHVDLPVSVVFNETLRLQHWRDTRRGLD
jgi:acyl carrier protein